MVPGIRKRGGVWETRIIFWIPTCRMPLHQMGILRISIVFMSLMCLIESEARTLESEQVLLISLSIYLINLKFITFDLFETQMQTLVYF